MGLASPGLRTFHYFSPLMSYVNNIKTNLLLGKIACCKWKESLWSMNLVPHKKSSPSLLSLLKWELGWDAAAVCTFISGVNMKDQAEQNWGQKSWKWVHDTEWLQEGFWLPEQTWPGTASGERRRGKKTSADLTQRLWVERSPWKHFVLPVPAFSSPILTDLSSDLGHWIMEKGGNSEEWKRTNGRG